MQVGRLTSRVSARTLHPVSARTTNLARMLLRAACVVGVASVVLCASGCNRSRSPWLFDAGPPTDGGPPQRDTDQDGLCDEQEVARGLRVDDPDTDADGFSDLTEVSLGLDPLSRLSPPTDRVIFLRESAEGTARATMTITVDGEGDTYSGSFTAVSPAFSDGVDADEYFAGAGPVGATPTANVFEIDESTQAFVGVRGLTLLTYEIRFRFEGAARECQRAYPFQYTVKRDDGAIVASQRFTLVITPASGAADAAEWCGAEPCF